MSIALGSSGYYHNELGDGRTVVTTAGTRVQVSATDTPIHGIIITAETDNTGYIVVGAVTNVAAIATRRGTPLSAGQSLTLYNTNLNQIYLDSTVSGDGISFIYFK